MTHYMQIAQELGVHDMDIQDNGYIEKCYPPADPRVLDMSSFSLSRRALVLAFKGRGESPPVKSTSVGGEPDALNCK